MTAVCKNIQVKSLQSQKGFASLLLPNVRSDRRNPEDYIFFNTAPAGLFSGKSDPIRFGRLATIRERLALSIFRHNAKFHSMPNVNEISGKGNNSTLTASGKKRPAETLIRKAFESTKCPSPIYKVSIHALGRFADDFKSGILITDIFQASNEEEAIGMACNEIKRQYPSHTIVAGRIKCSLLNPAAL